MVALTSTSVQGSGPWDRHAQAVTCLLACPSTAIVVELSAYQEISFSSGGSDCSAVLRPQSQGPGHCGVGFE